MRLPRLYPILDTAAVQARGWAVLPYAQALLEGGSEIIQFRHKGEFTRERFAQAQELGELVQAAGAAYVVNDRADIAALLDAALHLGQEDLPPAMARSLMGPDRAMGFSTHNRAQLAAAAQEPVDYVALGPIFETNSKERPDPVVGLDGLHACRSLTVHPLVAIGGITLETAPHVLAAGADSLAVINALAPVGATLADVRTLVETWKRLLESA